MSAPQGAQPELHTKSDTIPAGRFPDFAAMPWRPPAAERPPREPADWTTPEGIAVKSTYTRD